MSENIGTGLPESKPNPYWGSASGLLSFCLNLLLFLTACAVDVAKVHDDAAGYIATCEVSSKCSLPVLNDTE